jgi:hypothetical protein
VKFLGKLYRKYSGDFMLRVLDFIVPISFDAYQNCGCFNLSFNVWACVCVGFVICGCFGNMCTSIYCVLYCVF